MPETVYVRATNYEENVYHTDPGCPALEGEGVAKPRSVIPHRTECKKCAGVVENRGKGERQCPYCGETLYRLREHLPCAEVEG